MSEIFRELASLTPEQRALLELRLKQRPAPPVKPAISRIPRGDFHRLSFAQQRLWFLDQMMPGTAAYNVPLGIRMSGPLDRNGLAASLSGVVTRHEALRTTFDVVDGEPLQRIHPPHDFDLLVVDLEGVKADALEERALSLCREEIHRPFDLRRGPLFRGLLLRLAGFDHILVLTLHHIVSDAWSFSVLLRELGEIYRATVQADEARLPVLPVQYVDYAAWQRAAIESEALDAELGYWRRKLGGALPELALPTDHPRPAMQNFHGSRLPFAVGANAVSGLRELARSSGTTSFTVLLVAFAALLHRYTGEEDILVGVPIAGRSQAELEDLIGFFVNTLVLRVDLSGRRSFRDLVAQASATTLDAFSHQNLPFELLVQKLNPERDLGRNPLFQVMLSVNNTPRPHLSMAGLDLRPIALTTERSRFDLALSIAEGPRDLHGILEYRSDLFDPSTISRMAVHYRTLLAGALADPELRLHDLPLLTEVERRQVIEGWNGAGLEYEHEGTIHEVFEELAERSGGAVALLNGEERLTYAELNARANQLAHYLRRLGVEPDVVVGLLLERSVEMLVGVLGILKAGGAYVPLDPSYPAQRLHFMLSDTQAPVVLTHERLRPRISQEPGRQILCLDTEWEQVAAERTENPTHIVGAGNLAYVIYTSGSTGTPKGTLVAHRGLCNVSREQIRAFGVGPGSRVLQFSSLSFDAFVFETVMALASGATLVVGDREDLLPGPALVQLLRKQRVTLVTLPPSALAILPEDALPDLEIITVAGEACPAHLVERWAPGRRFFNLYGPTETTIWATMAPCSHGRRPPWIGKPIANTSAYVLDAWGSPVPVGVAGELYLGGDGLARGYLGRPELTAEKFVPDPFGPERGGRLYRTGDRVRWRDEGNLEFLGRVDAQVKVRGFRIELGEIEAVLGKCLGVQDCVVEARDDPRGKRLVSYVVGEPGMRLEAGALREGLKARLPDHMVPSDWVFLEKLPVTPNGKVDRKALPRPETSQAARALVVAANETEKTIAAIWADVLGVAEVSVHDNFFDLGGHSLLLVRVHSRLSESLNRAIPIVDLFRYTTVHSLAAHLSGAEEESPKVLLPVVPSAEISHDVAIVAMAGRFPGASTVEALWENLSRGVESIRFFTREELLTANNERAIVDAPAYVPASAPLDDADRFDAGFFKMSPRDAETTDPQHRLFLETVWEALERAGCDPARYRGKIGVYAGAGTNRYAPATFGTMNDFLTTRASYKLNLTGPSLDVQTACSTSLVAVHLACQALSAGECDLALAGGVTVRVPQETGYLYQEDGILSPDGHCRVFDADARGTVPGSGVGVVALKRLADALADSDPIHAVVKGTAINNDGSLKVGFTAPGVAGQSEAIASALARAGVAPETISYVEAHGTGTPLGDPAEVRALTQVFRGAARGSIALGSLKSNVGHLDTAAGVAGLIKVTLALEHGKIPPSLHYRRPNPTIDFDSGPFFVNAELREWSSANRPRRAGVSSFGIGGTNAHVVLEEAAPPEPSGPPTREREILVLSAKTASALAKSCDNLAGHLEGSPDAVLADVAHTLGIGRRAFSHRVAVVAKERNEAIEKLRSRSGPAVASGIAPESERPVVFLFSGQGSQHPGMARDVYESEAEFRAQLDRCVRVLEPHLGCDLRRYLFPDAGGQAEASERLNETWLTQPALFAVEYALARFWMSLGLTPRAMMGHSIGELVAATLAGVFDLEDALALVAKRGKLMQQAPPGAMLAIPLSEEEAAKLLRPGLALAAVNAPEQCVLAGSLESIEELSGSLAASGVEGVRLRTSHAFHSETMEDAARAFEREVAGLALGEPRIPFVSNLTGRFIHSEEARSASYWGRHLRNTVRFSEGLRELMRAEDAVFLEVGPGRTLSGLVRLHDDGGPPHLVVQSLPGSTETEGDAVHLLSALSRLWVAGAPVNWKSFRDRERRRRVRLPTYPFERQRFWIEPREGAVRTTAAKNPKLSEWLYLPSWKRTSPPVVEDSGADEGSWLVFRDRCGLGDELVLRLSERGARVTVVDEGRSFSRRQDGGYEVRPGNASDYEKLFSELSEGKALPARTLHLWGVGAARDADPAASQDVGFFSLVALAQALENESSGAPHRIVVVTSGMQEVSLEPPAHPEKATVLGPVRVIPQEYPGVRCKSIDVVLPEAPPGSVEGVWEKRLLEWLLAECLVETADAVVAYRGGHRWVETFEPAAIGPPSPARDVLRDHGVYVVTGGLGGIGLAIAEHLARQRKAKLVLISRSGLPEPMLWSRWLEEHGEGNEIADKIRRVRALEDAGAEVVIAAGDAADRDRMAEIFRDVESRFGRIHGILHSAGVAGSGLIQLKSRERAEAVLSSKVRGTLVLEELARAHGVDFLVLCSSLASTLGGTGQVDYCAANCFQDALATRAASRESVRVVSVNWDTWAEAGMAVSASVPELQREEARRLGMTSSEGVEVLRRILGSEAVRVLVSVRDLSPRIAFARRTDPAPAEVPAAARPALHQIGRAHV